MDPLEGYLQDTMHLRSKVFELRFECEFECLYVGHIYSKKLTDFIEFV